MDIIVKKDNFVSQNILLKILFCFLSVSETIQKYFRSYNYWYFYTLLEDLEADYQESLYVGGYFGASIREKLTEYWGLYSGGLHLGFFGIFIGKKGN